MARQEPNKDQLRLEGSRSADDTYSDGHPFDQVQYLEAKLILKPDRFTSLKTFHQFGKLCGPQQKNSKSASSQV